MKNAIASLSCLIILGIAPIAAAQARDEQAKPQTMAPPTAAEVQAKVEQTQAVKAKLDEAQASPRPMRALSNVQIELTLTDQNKAAAPEKKTVSMIVSDGSWGKIRNTAARVAGSTPVGLNVDARPTLRAEGQIQLELTLYYYPPQGDQTSPGIPTELNQSLTVQLQSGKPLIISQAADPVTDRKVIVEVKATIPK